MFNFEYPKIERLTFEGKKKKKWKSSCGNENKVSRNFNDDNENEMAVQRAAAAGGGGCGGQGGRWGGGRDSTNCSGLQTISD